MNKSIALSKTAIDISPVEASHEETLGVLWTDAAVKFADRVALRADGTELTYRELNQRSRALAVALLHAGLEPGEICGLYLERSIDCMISILAVTLAGAVWLPLDPAYPAARLRLMAEDADIKHLISNRDSTPLQLNITPQIHEIHKLNSADLINSHLTESDLKNPTQATDLAYVIYTSGSTGRPKGIQIEHCSLVAFLKSMQALLNPNSLAHIFSVTSPNFDISLLELFLPLISGGTVTLATRAEARDGRLLAARLQSERPSLVQATPATWRMLLAAGWQGHDDLTLLTGGETIASDMALELMARADDVWNLYGPTEATVWATAAHLTQQDARAGAIPIGYPLAHVETCILGEDGQILTKGEIGELCLLGLSLSRGYIGQPELTKRKFFNLPIGRAYRTGDRVSLRPDGQLAFHGRIDNQIKLNSYRIEPVEIENVLSDHSEVRDSLVTLKEVGDGQPRLVAYIVPETFDPGHHRQQRLAEHWRAIWTREYDAMHGHLDDPTFNTAGLRSSYDGQPLAEPALRDMVAQSCERVRAFEPKRILDLGCGSGLMLFPLAPNCESYVAVDFSAGAIADLERETALQGLTNVQFLKQAANVSANIEADCFDVVILNTVIQYFPDIDYLEAVLDNALRALRPGGVIFIGDVRELGALEAFHASVIQARAASNNDIKNFHEELHRMADKETELVFDLGWFEVFAATRSSITAIEAAYKEGPFRNEVIDYRFDVILRKGGTAEQLVPDLIHDGEADRSSLAELWRQLKKNPAECVLIKNLLNTRRQEASTFLQSLQADCKNDKNISSIGLDRSSALNPDDVVRDGLALGYRVVLLPDPAGSPKHFAALLVRDKPGVTLWSHRPRVEIARQTPALLSNELQQSLAAPSLDHADLIGQLQNLAGQHFPGPMCPTHYVILRELPLTSARKIDRQALPPPLCGRPSLRKDFVPARDALELHLTGLISENLGVNPVGVHDGFFDLGGDSLATVELLLAIHEKLGVEIEMGHFLEDPTAAGLAAIINKQRGFRPATALITLKAGNAETPLFIIHGAGGLAFTIFGLGQALTGEHPVIALQDPSWDPGIEPARCVEEMATALIEQIKTVQPNGPYRLCGHSFGGLLAYEMAIQLRAQGKNIAFLGMLDTPIPPAAEISGGFGSRLRVFWRELRVLGQILSQAGPMMADGCYVLFAGEAHFHNNQSSARSLPDMIRGLWANGLFRYFHRRAGLASALERDSRLLMLRQPSIRRSISLTGIHETARRRYLPGDYDGTIHLFRSEDASAETQGFPDDTLGWNRFVPEIVMHRSPGTHFTMTRGNNVKHLARALSRALDERF